MTGISIAGIMGISRAQWRCLWRWGDRKRCWFWMRNSKVTVGVWRRRFLAHGVRGLYDELRTGRPRPISDERVAQLVRKTLKTKPRAGTHWSIRQIAAETQLSKSTVHRIWQAFGLQPHRQKHFKLSNDPFFVEKVRDIVGLYLNPPENAVVLC